MQNIDVSIIIVNYNTSDLTLQCLRSVYDKTVGLSFEVIVVDNASSDESVKLIESNYPHVILVKSFENIGFGRANNLGYKYSKGNYIFLLNSDTILINNAVYLLWKFLSENKNISIAGGQLFEKDGVSTTHSYSFLFPSIWSEIDLLFRGRITRKIENKKQNEIVKDGFVQVSYITGADMMLRRDDIQQLGFFNPVFFLYFEETELSYRYYCKGRVSAFLPAAKIIHLCGSSFSLKKNRSKYYKDGRKKYFKIAHSTPHYIIANIIRLITYVTIIIEKATKFI